MISGRRRIRRLEKYTTNIKEGSNIAVGITDPERFLGIFENIGFSHGLVAGESLLPSASLGPVCKFNAEGGFIRHRDQPKETHFRETEWHWNQWAGGGETEEQSKIVDVPYERYPRTSIPPPSVEITIFQNIRGDFLITSPTYLFSEGNKKTITHVINLFLEIFRECSFFAADLNEIIRAPIQKLNWKVLPPGQLPWEILSHEIEPMLHLAPDGNHPVIWHRFEAINEYHPDFAAVGRAGFSGYVIFGFRSKGIFVCESVYFGNATYVFDDRWEELSKKTKAEILSNDYQVDRIIHRAETWDTNIRQLLS